MPISMAFAFPRNSFSKIARTRAPVPRPWNSFDRTRRWRCRAGLPHRGGGPDAPEPLAVRPPDLPPVVHSRHEDPGPDHVVEPRPRLLQGRLDVPEGLDRLRVRVPGAHDVPRGGRR